MNRVTTAAFKKLNNPIFQKEVISDQRKIVNSKSELKQKISRISRDEFLQELGKALGVLANR